MNNQWFSAGALRLVLLVVLITFSVTAVAVAPGGMFRRVETAPHVAIKGIAPTAATYPSPMTEQNLALNVSLPSGLALTDTEIAWDIHASGNAVNTRLYGQKLGFTLPNGQYQITLTIGAYRENTSVSVQQGKLAVTTFNPRIGRLQGESGLLAAWEVFAVKAGIPPEKILSHERVTRFQAIVPEGEYDVLAHIGDAQQLVRVRVGNGASALTRMDIPTGRVNLLATLGNTPAMRPMSWKVFRLDGQSGRREVASPERHSASLVVPPGHYEAVATLNGKQRSRAFTVSKGTLNSIVLAMD
ncbi:hypothetical protein [Candidatus Thiothrix anitrata]|uniref:DUF4198 domain-containing protein n=1 Tax=Candidatus Thiothrix anitrata TaxID=2823902 RepID=A0ABX7X4L3_9GAMM|nr:hypothetical protein [Candidatus Thiothrix anitrata]QTR50810.1 hypothetical protein J8380_04370 [Candidatus Thiothrix anitrata]